MQTVPGRATVSRRTFTQEPERHGGAEPAPLTPAERIALTIALINRGLDLIDGFARTALSAGTRMPVRGEHAPERERRLPGIT
jgi:hypothetical protein